MKYFQNMPLFMFLFNLLENGDKKFYGLTFYNLRSVTDFFFSLRDIILIQYA